MPRCHDSVRTYTSTSSASYKFSDGLPPADVPAWPPQYAVNETPGEASAPSVRCPAGCQPNSKDCRWPGARHRPVWPRCTDHSPISHLRLRFRRAGGPAAGECLPIAARVVRGGWLSSRWCCGSRALCPGLRWLQTTLVLLAAATAEQPGTRPGRRWAPPPVPARRPGRRTPGVCQAGCCLTPSGDRPPGQAGCSSHGGPGRRHVRRPHRSE